MMKTILITLITLMALCHTTVIKDNSTQNPIQARCQCLGREIRCAIRFGGESYITHGRETGMNYEFMKKFAEDNKCKADIITTDRKSNFLDSLKQGKIDILITSKADSTSIKEIYYTTEIDKDFVWGINRSNKVIIKAIEQWVTFMKASKSLDEIKNKYQGYFNSHKSRKSGVTKEHITPYYELIKKYAAEIGWDWRMIAAVIYQESKFTINAKSHRGAVGLMQIMPRTGKAYGVTKLEDPELNVSAGTRHLKRLHKMAKKWAEDEEEILKFTLAAYNAGEGRIIDCRKFAESNGYDNTKWDEVALVIPLMRDDSILKDKNIKHGKFKGGRETVRYVTGVMSHYSAICKLYPEK